MLISPRNGVESKIQMEYGKKQIDPHYKSIQSTLRV